MSKSLYEKYAEEAQPGVLAKTISLEEAVESIKGYKDHFSKEYVEWAEEICADMFGRTFEEVRDLVNGKPYWLSIAGMYEDNPGRNVVPEHVFHGEVHMPYDYEIQEQERIFPILKTDKRNRLENIVSSRLRSFSGIHSVSIDDSTEYGCGFVFDFSFCSGMDVDAIRRALSGMFNGLKHSFYLDHNLDERLADAAMRSEMTANNDISKDDFEKV